MQTVHRQMNSPQEEEIRIRPVCGVELAAQPTKTFPYNVNVVSQRQRMVAQPEINRKLPQKRKMCSRIKIHQYVS